MLGVYVIPSTDFIEKGAKPGGDFRKFLFAALSTDAMKINASVVIQIIAI